MDSVWTRKKPEMNSGGLLRDGHGGRRNTFTVGNGHYPGAPPELEKPGNRAFQRVPGTGGRHTTPVGRVTGRLKAAAGQSADRNRSGWEPAELEPGELGNWPILGPGRLGDWPDRDAEAG